jgi:hypothetical protein
MQAALFRKLISADKQNDFKRFIPPPHALYSHPLPQPAAPTEKRDSAPCSAIIACVVTSFVPIRTGFDTHLEQIWFGPESPCPLSSN